MLYSNHLYKIGLKIANDVHTDLCFKNEFLHLENEKKKKKSYSNI